MATSNRQRWGVRLISYRFIMGGVARRRLDDERGSALPELAIAMLVLSVAILGVVGSMGLSMQLVGDSRQRSSGVGVATERLERIHDLDYEVIAIKEEADNPLQYEADSPNSDITDVGCPDPPSDAKWMTDVGCYRLADGNLEALLVVDPDYEPPPGEPKPPEGVVRHVDDPITVGNTEFRIYQYVTAGPDLDGNGEEDSRRVTVVVVWKFPVQSGTTNRAVQSTIITPGTVTVPAPTPPEIATPVPPTSQPTNCNESSGGWGATGKGTMQIISGSGAEAGFTSSTSVQVTLEPADHNTTDRVELQSIVNGVSGGFLTVACWGTDVNCEPRDPDTDLYPPVTITWTIPDNEVEQTIEARFRSVTNQCSDRPSDSITLDRTAPTTPGNLREVSCTGPPSSDRNVTMTWDPSTDANLLGYRVYRSIDAAPYQAIATVATTSASDTSSKNHGSVRYVVRAYDKAGNESVNSNAVSYSKNSC